MIPSGRPTTAIFAAALILAGQALAPAAAADASAHSVLRLEPVTDGRLAALPSARRAGPANDEANGATDLGTTLPVSRTFTFEGATAGHYDFFGQAAGTVWFKVRAAATGFMSATIAPTSTGGGLVLGLVLSDGFEPLHATTPFASARPGTPVKVTGSVVKGRTYYVTAALLGPTTRARDRKRTVRLSVSQPKAGMETMVFAPEATARVRDADTDGFGFNTSVLTTSLNGTAELSAAVSYPSAVKNFLVPSGTERRSVTAFYRIDASVPVPKPAALQANVAAEAVFRIKDHSFGNTLPPVTLTLFSDTTAAADAKGVVRAYAPRRPLTVRPGSVARWEFVVTAGPLPFALVAPNLTGCRVLSTRAASWRFYDRTGTKPLAGTNAPATIRASAGARLRIAIPMSATVPEQTTLVSPRLAIDCANTEIATLSLPVEVTSRLPPSVDVDILDADRKVDLFADETAAIDVRVSNRSGRAQSVRLVTNTLAGIVAIPSCLLTSGRCGERFGFQPRITVPAGASRTIRFLPRPANSGVIPPDEVAVRFTVRGFVKVDEQLDTEVFRASGSDSIAVSLNCPKPLPNGGCPAVERAGGGQ